MKILQGKTDEMITIMDVNSGIRLIYVYFTKFCLVQSLFEPKQL